MTGDQVDADLTRKKAVITTAVLQKTDSGARIVSSATSAVKDLMDSYSILGLGQVTEKTFIDDYEKMDQVSFESNFDSDLKVVVQAVSTVSHLADQESLLLVGVVIPVYKGVI